jgi:thioredoxin 1
MHKELDKLSAAFKSVRFAKLDCEKGDSGFATRQRIRSLPTFRLYHGGRCVDEVTGAKPLQLRQLLMHYMCLLSV